MICLHRNGDRHSASVHRLVAMAFLGEPPSDKVEVNHKDGNKENNAIGNLEWVTRSENMKHAIAKLGMVPPTSKGCYKISDETVRRMRQEYIPYKVTVPTIAKRYGVSVSYAGRIIKGDVR